MKTCVQLLNALVISNLHYAAIQLNGISSDNLATTLQKHLDWAIEACLNRNKIEYFSDLKTKHKIRSVRFCSGQNLQFTTGSIEKIDTCFSRYAKTTN